MVTTVPPPTIRSTFSFFVWLERETGRRNWKILEINRSMSGKKGLATRPETRRRSVQRDEGQLSISRLCGNAVGQQFLFSIFGPVLTKPTRLPFARPLGFSLRNCST